MPALALQMFFDETVPAWQSSHLQGRTFYNGALFNFLQPDSFFTLLCTFIYKTQFNLTISSHLPGLLDYCRTLKLRTFYNSDGLINWLRQPWQFCTQPLKFEWAGGQRTGATFFARYLDYFIVTHYFSATYRDWCRLDNLIVTRNSQHFSGTGKKCVTATRTPTN